MHIFFKENYFKINKSYNFVKNEDDIESFLLYL